MAFMNIHGQARLLVKYELITPSSLRERAILKSILQKRSFRQDIMMKPNEPQILTHMYVSSVTKAQVMQLRTRQQSL